MWRSLVVLSCLSSALCFSLDGKLLRQARAASGASGASATLAGDDEGPSSGAVVSSSSSSSGGGGSRAGSSISSTGGVKPVVGSIHSQVSNEDGTISSGTGPVIIPAGSGVGNGVSIGNGGGGAMVNGQAMCALQQNVCEQCLRLNQLQRVIAQTSSGSVRPAALSDISCPGFCSGGCFA